MAYFKEFLSENQGDFPVIRFHGKDMLEIEAVLNFMLKEFETKDIGYMVTLKGYANVLLAKFFRAVRKSDIINVREDIDKITPKVLEYIDTNYNKKLSLK